MNTADSNPSKSEIDRLGDRLRVSDTPDDRQMLDMYCRTFVKAYEIVLRQIYVTHGFNKVGRRRAKSHGAIVDKLKRESIRLSQMQDIAGCRIVVPDVARQNALLEKLRVSFSEVEISDRRKNQAMVTERFICWCRSKIVALKYKLGLSFKHFGLNFQKSSSTNLVLP